MELSLILAKILGLYLVIVAIAMLVKPSGFVNTFKDLIGSPGKLGYAGLLSVLFGVILVSIHNIWVANWHVVITLLGWLTLIRGVVRLFFPNVAASLANNLSNKPFYYTVAIIGLLIGLFLVYHGYGLIVYLN